MGGDICSVLNLHVMKAGKKRSEKVATFTEGKGQRRWKSRFCTRKALRFKGGRAVPGAQATDRKLERTELGECGRQVPALRLRRPHDLEIPLLV